MASKRADQFDPNEMNQLFNVSATKKKAEDIIDNVESGDDPALYDQTPAPVGTTVDPEVATAVKTAEDIIDNVESGDDPAVYPQTPENGEGEPSATPQPDQMNPGPSFAAKKAATKAAIDPEEMNELFGLGDAASKAKGSSKKAEDIIDNVESGDDPSFYEQTPSSVQQTVDPEVATALKVAEDIIDNVESGDDPSLYAQTPEDGSGEPTANPQPDEKNDGPTFAARKAAARAAAPRINKAAGDVVDLSHTLSGKTVVLTGKPPTGYQKKDISNLLVGIYGAAAVEPAFTKRTQVVVYEKRSTDTSKLSKAKQAGLTTIPYEDLLQ